MDNTVIMGGLFAVAIIAMLLLIFALVSEKRAQDKVALATASPSTATENITAENKVPLPAQRVAQPDTQQDRDRRLPVPRGENGLQSPSSRQLNELATELHTLHRQAQEVEHKIAILVDVVDRLERPQPGRTVIQEERQIR
ncbi:MAG TPA: hypothetical protein VHZ51_09660 [Ktedonobacteraceae bacterium]|nr:hypothetical protein [Ktedonobacteraceae bacterium]